MAAKDSVENSDLIEIHVKAKKGHVAKSFFVGSNVEPEDITKTHFLLSKAVHDLLGYKVEDYRVDSNGENPK